MENRNKNVTFRLSEKELDLVNNFCKENGIDRSDLIRTLLLKEVDRPVQIDKETIKTAINKAYQDVLDINFDKQKVIVKKSATTTAILKYELIENNRIILIRNEFGAIKRRITI